VLVALPLRPGGQPGARQFRLSCPVPSILIPVGWRRISTRW